MKQEPTKMNEKTVRVLSCAVAVGVMILLLSGDMIISQFIPYNPNQEYPYEEARNKNFSWEKISIKDALQKIETNFSVYLVFEEDEKSIQDAIFSFMQEKSLDYASFSCILTGEIDVQSAEYATLLNYSDEIAKHYTNVPFVLSFENHQFYEIS